MADAKPPKRRFKHPPPTYDDMRQTDGSASSDVRQNAWVDCGWGRIIMGHTYADPSAIAGELLREAPNRRDIAMFVADPHVVLASAPQQLFLDPSDTYRLELGHRHGPPAGCDDIVVREVASLADAIAVNAIYAKRDMVQTPEAFAFTQGNSPVLTYLVAEDPISGEILGTVMGIDHVALFNDPNAGCSLWCLAVDPQAARPRIGELLVRALADHFHQRGRRHMDLSVLHDNLEAKALYGKLGFHQIHTFAVKNKNAFNETLFIGPEPDESLNPYARIIVDEARARGIGVEVLDAEEGYFRLTHGARSITCRESLSELTSAVAMSRCQDKYVTHRWLRKIGIKTPSFRIAGAADADQAFLATHGQLVVKPAIGEQGQGISIGVATPAELEQAIVMARQFSNRVLLESYHAGVDLRIVVINYEVVAAAIRKPPQVIGDGVNDVATLIEKQSRRRMVATDGESRIPIDDETTRCLAAQNLTLASVLPPRQVVTVRKTANLHTGGTIHDVTDALHPVLRDAAFQAARQLEIPVVGLDLMVTAPDRSDYVMIEANERAGLANHEPQPTAQRFIDLLFPLSQSFRDRQPETIRHTDA
ncbi:MAG: N-acetylglutaminylglutamine synthetase [Gammaproteobacteria bacterium]|nr:N-acetylglutaminylglutamine synthetase [Gammaproteobacteria bacterium]